MNIGLIFVFVVTLVTWLGVFTYLLMIDRSLRKMEQKTHNEDSL